MTKIAQDDLRGARRPLSRRAGGICQVRGLIRRLSAAPRAAREGVEAVELSASHGSSHAALAWAASYTAVPARTAAPSACQKDAGLRRSNDRSMRRVRPSRPDPVPARARVPHREPRADIGEDPGPSPRAAPLGDTSRSLPVKTSEEPRIRSQRKPRRVPAPLQPQREPRHSPTPLRTAVVARTVPRLAKTPHV